MSKLTARCVAAVFLAMFATPTSSVAADAHDADASILVGGQFTRLGSSQLAVIGLSSGSESKNPIHISGVKAVLTRGSWTILGGEFRSVAGTIRSGLVRFSDDGIIDATWTPHVDGTVLALAASEDHLYFGGRFETVDGQARRNLACVSWTDGALVPWQADTDGQVLTLAATRAAVVVGGSFMTVAGEPRMHLAKLSSQDGTPDPAFVGVADSEVRAVIIRGEDLYLGGQFTRINAEARRGLARVDLATGSVDATWRADVDGAVFALSAVRSQLYVGGAFSAISNQNRTNVARVALSDGSVEAWQPEPNEQITAIAEPGAGRIVLGGRFTTLNEQPHIGIAVVSEKDGTPIPGWRSPLTGNQPVSSLALSGEILWTNASLVRGRTSAGAAWLAASSQSSNQLLTLDGSDPRILCGVQHQGWIYIGGDFSIIDGHAHLGLARLDARTRRVDPTWRHDANGSVHALAVLDNQLYIGGDFTKLAGRTCQRAARIDLTTGNDSEWGCLIDGPVRAILPTPAGVLISGTFTAVAGQPRRALARLTLANGQLDSAFTTDLAREDAPGLGRALCHISPQQVVVGGAFTRAAGTPANNLALLDLRTGSVLPWRGSADGAVFALAYRADVGLVVAGTFRQLAGEPRHRLGLLDPVRGRALPWRTDADADVHAVTFREQELWLGGDFTTIGGAMAVHLARLALVDGSLQPLVATDARVESIISTSNP